MWKLPNPTKFILKVQKINISENQLKQQAIVFLKNLKIVNLTKVCIKTTKVIISKNQFKKQTINLHERESLKGRHLVVINALTIIAGCFMLLIVLKSICYIEGAKQGTKLWETWRNLFKIPIFQTYQRHKSLIDTNCNSLIAHIQNTRIDINV